MNLHQVSVALLFFCFLFTFTNGSNNPIHSTGYASINCGSIGTFAASNGKEWIGDVQPKPSSFLQLHGSSTTSTVTHKWISADPVPYKTARVSRSQFSYSFQVSPESYAEIWDESNIRLTKYDWDIISTATNKFASYSKIGRGGFGCVYKGVLPTGQVIAVKRFPSSSGQGLKKFENEILLLPNLQHRNIIKILGYSIHREEKLIVYEFMENTSLDTFMRVQHGSFQWGWAHRFKIILGIARGVVYLHQDSGLRVIHTDLELSKILLDVDMNPKISDFAMARSLVENHSEMVSQTPVVIYGYIPPECFKSDVYGFGIVILEILSDRRRMEATEPTSICDYAWELWNEGRAYDLVDESLKGAFPEEEALRCIQVGLLCTQMEPNHRPTMPSVLKMLEGNELLVVPQQSQTFQESFEEICASNTNLINFNWDTINIAINRFSYSNKVGQAIFSPVYKGVLPTGQLVTV